MKKLIEFLMMRSRLVLPRHGIAVLSGSVDVHYALIRL